jgi:hypothetical protein
VTLYMRGYGQSSMGFSEVNSQTLVLENGHRLKNNDMNMVAITNGDPSQDHSRTYRRSTRLNSRIHV